MFKKEWKIVLVSLFLLVAVVACTTTNAASPVTAQEVTETPDNVLRTITVVGNGQVSLTPDTAVINVGAEARAGTVSDAKTMVDAQIQTILSALIESGIAEKDIQTANYSIYFDQDFVKPVVGHKVQAETEQGQYRVSNTMRVTVRDIDKVGDVLDAVVLAGANQIYGVHFTVDDDTAWKSIAREAAVSDAKSRAQELAQLTGVSVGRVLSVSEVIGSSPVAMPMFSAERAYGGGIAPGELEFSTQIQVVFEIN